MIAVYAHGFGGADELPIPKWLLTYLIAFAVVLTFIALRFVRPPRKPRPSNGSNARITRVPTARTVARVVGLILFLGTFAAAAFGVDDSSANIATVTVIVLFFLGMQVVSAVFGDVYWWFNPFDTLAGLFFRNDDGEPGEYDEDDESEAPSWTAAAFLTAFMWFVFVYPEFYPPSPRNVAVFLAVYTVAVLAGAGRWGRAWVRRGEGFGALFGALARLGRRPDTDASLAPLFIVYLGGILFDGLSQTNWWIDVLGTSRGWTERSINTVGLAWSIAIVAVAYLAACAVIAYLADTERGRASTLFARVLLPIGLAWSVAHYLPAFLLDVQYFYALLSDPLGQGWDLFGTVDYTINNQVLTPTQLGVVQAIVLGAGSIAAAVIAHDATFSNYRGRAAVRATYPMAVLIIGAAVGAIWLLLGV